MSFELVFTSAPKGLKPGTRGFASVAFTEGMPSNYVQFCESLSGYVHIFLPQDENYSRNPIAFSHLLATLGGKTFSVLSRVAAYGIDYTGRSNKIAHHILITPEERTAPGPAVLMSRDEVFRTEWSGPPQYLPPTKVRLSGQDITSYRAHSWEKLFGDAGGAGILAQSFLDAPSRPVFLLFNPGMNVLPLLAEAQALLPAEHRWRVSFTTYFTSLPVGLDCAWRCCLPDSDALKLARRTQDALLIDLVGRKVKGPAPSSQELVECARSGRQPAAAVEAETVPQQKEELPSPAQPVATRASPAPRPKLPSRLAPQEKAKGYSPDPMRPQRTVRRKDSTLMLLAIVLVVGFAAFGMLISGRVQKSAQSKKPAPGTNGPQSEDLEQNESLVPTAPSKEPDATQGTAGNDEEGGPSDPTLDAPTDDSASRVEEEDRPLTPQRSAQLISLKEGRLALPLVTSIVFYTTSGEEVNYRLEKSSVSFEPPKYKRTDGGEPLAQIYSKDSEVVCYDFDKTVRLVMVSNGYPSISVIKPFDAEVEQQDDKSLLRLRLHDGKDVGILMQYVYEHKDDCRAQGIAGQTGVHEYHLQFSSKTDPILLEPDSERRRQIRKAQDERAKQQEILDEEIKCLKEKIEEYNRDQKKIQAALDSFLQQDKTSKSKKKGEEPKEKAELCELLTRACCQHVDDDVNTLDAQSQFIDTWLLDFKNERMKRYKDRNDSARIKKGYEEKAPDVIKELISKLKDELVYQMGKACLQDLIPIQTNSLARQIAEKGKEKDRLTSSDKATALNVTEITITCGGVDVIRWRKP